MDGDGSHGSSRLFYINMSFVSVFRVFVDKFGNYVFRILHARYHYVLEFHLFQMKWCAHMQRFEKGSLGREEYPITHDRMDVA